MNLIARTKNSLEFNFFSTVFFCLLFTQFFNNSTQLNIGIWQEKSDYNSISTNASTLTTNASTLERIGNNFLLKSRQNLSESDSYNIRASIINYY